MTVLSVDKNATELSMVVTAEFAASVDDVWRLWADAQLFARWWAPPGFEVTSEEHDVRPQGRIAFFFTSAEGEKYPMEWEVLEVDAPSRLVLRDADVDENGEPNDGNGLTTMEIAVLPAGDKTRMLVTSGFASLEGMEQAVEVGFDEGLRFNLGQAETVLAEVATAS
jgi:uncharacterized protein YndB with AHSA1/START domain